MTPPTDHVISCNLVKDSRKHVRFLQGLHEDGTMFATVSPESLDRYLNYWLPLVTRNHAAFADDDVGETTTTPAVNELLMIPPPDVAWLWHCHRLSPMNYGRFVRKRYGVLLEANPSFAVQREQDDDTQAFLTRDAWYAAYSDEPFFLQEKDGASKFPPGIIKECHDLEGFDLIASTKNQSTFLWQVAGPSFGKDLFLFQGADNYHKFLQLSSTGLPLVPTYQIDLMWHTHILASLSNYHADCIAIRGEKFHHDDSLNDRTSGGKLDISFRETESLWRDAYGIEYVVEGGMYRGKPPDVYYDVAAWKNASKESTMDAFVAQTTAETLPEAVATAVTAASTGQSEERVWLDPKRGDTDSRGQPAFYAAKPQSHARTVNNNEKRSGYMFGRGSAGDGYYSPETRDFYKILSQRLGRQAGPADLRLDSYECRNCICCGCKPSSAQVIELAALRDKVEELRAMRVYTKLRGEASAPGTHIAAAKLPKSDGYRTANDNDSRGAYVVYSDEALCGAGGCGGGISAGGCGGGGACGGGGCGGGGGGCGGGGCGGGGGGCGG